MKLLTYCVPDEGVLRLGALTAAGDCVIDLAQAHMHEHGTVNDAFASMQSLIEAGPAALALARALVDQARSGTPIGNVKLAAPLPLPVQIRDCMCFEQHLLGSMAAVAKRTGAPSERQLAMHRIFQERPIYYKANRFATAGPEAVVAWPSYSTMMDYELEMGCILWSGGRNIRKEDASRHIFGFTIFNDFSARDVQSAEMECGLGPSKSKDFDNANVFGPVIVTADSFNPYDVHMTVRINGEVRSEGSSSTMTYRFEDLIAFISRDETLHPGEILCSGTVGGGCGLEQGQLLEHGDVIELEIEGIGVLRNSILAASSGG